MNTSIKSPAYSLATLLAVSTILSSAGTAFAQDAQDDADMDVIIVTAQKREQTLQEVPIAITALSAADLEAARIEDTLDLQFNVPNVLLSANRNITIRGVGSQSFGGTSDTNIGVLNNGVFLQSGTTFGEYFDLERIEVLRGPQGTLQGRNTTGGVINFISQKPTDEYGGYVTIQGESFNGVRASGALNLPINDVLSQRFAANFVKRDGYTKNLFDGGRIDGRDQYTLRSSTRFDNGTTSADLVLTYFNEDSNRANAVKTLCSPDPAFGCSPDRVDTQFPTSTFRLDAFLLPGITRDGTFVPNPSDLRTVNIDINPVQDNDDFLATFELNHDFGNFLLTSVTGYRDGNSRSIRDFDQGYRPNAFNPGTFGARTVADDGNGNGVLTYQLFDQPNDIFVTTTDYRTAQTAKGFRDQFSQEVRLASDLGGRFDFLVGGYYLNSDGGGSVNTYLPAAAVVALTTTGAVESYAVFGEIYVDLSDDLEFIGGLRYSDDTKNISTANGLFALPAPNVQEASFDKVTGRAVLNWSPQIAGTDDTNIYASFSRGYKSGGFNPGNAVNPVFEDEVIDAYEIGAKSIFADGALQLNTAAFYYDYQSLIVGNIVGTLATNVNIPKSEVYGLEVETVYAPGNGLRLEGALGLLSAQIQSSFLSSDAARGGTFFEIQGNDLPNSPKRTLKVAAEYEYEVGDSWRVTPRVDYYNQTGFFSREFNTPSDKVEGWDQLDLQVAIANDDMPWDLTFFVKNVLDENSITFLETNSNLVGSFKSAFLLDPRIFGAALHVDF
ncbi:TonB-dependent receptor [Algimonas ampicilliniresistens]|uniref:TonB-dependent receptor n=1 Tax=Algimonas ampicilliniresistens TaxID=1298735 RepID=A0ABQ5V5V0_9PROT|nr:TonB-dependent receptor [Algimonas ampicilliniresistens]GLQ22359.1 TonB-dependent receptor [Algimonas ampicilliniresistens]